MSTTIIRTPGEKYQETMMVAGVKYWNTSIYGAVSFNLDYAEEVVARLNHKNMIIREVTPERYNVFTSNSLFATLM